MNLAHSLSSVSVKTSVRFSNPHRFWMSQYWDRFISFIILQKNNILKLLPKDGTFTEYLITVMNVGGGFNCSLEFVFYRMEVKIAIFARAFHI